MSNKPHTIPTGHICLWYRSGSRDSIPAVGIVVASNPLGVLELAVLAKGYREPQLVRGVRHYTDPELKRNPQLAVDNGTWDYTDSDVLCPEKLAVTLVDRFGSVEAWFDQLTGMGKCIEGKRAEEQKLTEAAAEEAALEGLDEEARLKSRARALYAKGVPTGEIAQKLQIKKSVVEELVSIDHVQV